MKVFISYGSAADQVTALRLQALGAVNGLTVSVPPAHTRQLSAETLDPDTLEKLQVAEVVLGIIGSGVSPACRQELESSRALGTATVVLADPAVAGELALDDLIILDPAHPDRTETAILEHLRTIDATPKAKTALIALGTLALGLLIFAPQD